MPDALHDSLACLFTAERATLVAWLSGRYPGLGPARAEDAAQDAFFQVLARPGLRDLAGTVLEKDGLPGLRRLVFTVALRSLRGTWRRKATRCEQPFSAQLGAVDDSNPEDAVAEREARALMAALALPLARRAAGEASGVHQEAVAQALLALLADPETSQGVIAQRHGVRREYVSRAWTRLIEQASQRGIPRALLVQARQLLAASPDLALAA